MAITSQVIASQVSASDYHAWRDSIMSMLNTADNKWPGARAAFVAWARADGKQKAFAEHLRLNASDGDIAT